MRQRSSLFAALLLVTLSVTATAQDTYLVTPGSAVYTDLVNPVLISRDLDQVGYRTNMPFTMAGFGIPLDFDLDPQPVVVFTGGFIGILAPSIDKLFVIDAFVSNLERRDSTSSLSYRLEGEGEGRVLKFQWKNMKMTGNPEGDFINVQLWLYRNDNSFEIHVGPNRVTGRTAYNTYAGPAIGAFLSNSDLSEYFLTVHLAGNPANPGLETFNAFYPMGGTPSDGTVYRFTYQQASAVDEAGTGGSIRLSPNPASDGFTVQLPGNREDGHGLVAVYDLLGRQVLRESDVRDGGYISTQSLPPDIYQVVVYDRGNIVLTQRLVVAR